MIGEHEREEYLEKMNKPLSEQEIQQIKDVGYEFLNEKYIFLPDDEDGSMAYGIPSIRKFLLRIQHPKIFWKHQGHCYDILKEIEDLNKS